MNKGIKYEIFGGGFLGTYLSKNLEGVVLNKSRLLDEGSIKKSIQGSTADVIINCIGKTGNPNVDWCEKNKYATYFSNTMLPIIMAQECYAYGKKFINIGTGCVFHSDEMLDDNATPNFFGSFYSRTKLMAEDVIVEIPNTTNIRIRLPISGENSPKNFLYKANKYQKVTKIPNSVTFVRDIANGIEFIVENEMYGNINLVHPKPTTIMEVASIMGRDNYTVVESQEDLNVGKRANTVLNPARLLFKGFKFVDFEQELKKCVLEMNN